MSTQEPDSPKGYTLKSPKMPPAKNWDYSTFGRQVLSTDANAPGQSIGKGTRQKALSIYNKEGIYEVRQKQSPGPKYRIHENKRFSASPRIGFSTDDKLKVIKPLYNHYSKTEEITDPIRANIYTKKFYGTSKFGTEERKPQYQRPRSPGPVYKPKCKSVQPQSPRYSLNGRNFAPRSGATDVRGSTSIRCGPGRYSPENSCYTTHRNSSRYSVPKNTRFHPLKKEPRKQTYDTSGSNGKQASSRRATSASWGFGSVTREMIKKQTIPMTMMSTRPMSIRINHRY